MSEAQRAIIAGHGTFAAGLVSAVEQITGLKGRLVPLSNTGLSPAGMDAAIRDAMATSGARIIFTDLAGGSCTMAARRIAHAEPGLVVVTGIALPTLLTFACGSEVEDAVASGRDALQVVEGRRGA